MVGRVCAVLRMTKAYVSAIGKYVITAIEHSPASYCEYTQLKML